MSVDIEQFYNCVTDEYDLPTGISVPRFMIERRNPEKAAKRQAVIDLCDAATAYDPYNHHGCYA